MVYDAGSFEGLLTLFFARQAKQVVYYEPNSRNNLPAPNLMKIDIEGWELAALKGAAQLLQRFRPSLYLEMHGATMAEKKQKVRDIVGLLEETGYRTIEHIETRQRVTSANSEIAVEGHLYCPRGTV